jgi:AraC-like DNA-binding protein
MPDYEDMILPDDFQEDTTPTETTEPVETPVETEDLPQATDETVAEALQTLKVKYNKEEREIPIDEAIPLVQKGLNYDKVQERLQALESDPRYTFIEEIANQFGMSPQEYMDAVRQQQEQSRIDELVQQGISQELAQEILENKKFRDQYEAEKKAKQQEEQKNAEFQDFFRYFNQVNGRDFNAETDDIPPSVWEATEKGIPLRYAYMEHQNQLLQQQLQTLKQNQSNAQKAPIQSVTAHGGAETESEDDFLAGFNSI